MKTDKISEWLVAQARLRHYKKLEADLRCEICDDMFGGRTGRFSEKSELDLENGQHVMVKATSVTNRSVDEEMLHQLYADGFLTEADNLCFVRKLAIVEKYLNKAPSTSNVWKAITEKPGMPKLEVKQV